MIVKNDHFQEIIRKYKKTIAENKLKNEIYKWELLEQFDGLFDINSVDFYQEVKKVKFANLLYHNAIAVLHQLAKEKPEELRSLFTNLYNEDFDLKTRILNFKEKSLELYRNIGETLQHHQDERSISTYLTFYNHRKYTFYKSSFYKKLCKLLGINEAKKNEKYMHYLNIIDDFVNNYIVTDKNLIDLVKNLIPQYYDGVNHKF